MNAVHMTLGVMRATGFISLGVMLVFCSSAAFAQDISASSVIEQIERSGPKDVIYRYFDKTEWRTILHGIGTGEDSWLKVYSELRKGSDAASGEDLSAALWDSAVLVAPYKVFVIEKYDSCEFTFEAECPPGGVSRYLSRLENALAQASTPEQKAMKKRCLAGIKKTRALFSKPKAYCAL